MENLSEKYKHIKGWGIDANPLNDPTYPIKNYTGDDHKRINYRKPVQQDVNIEVLHSNERPGVSSVFGTTLPPRGLSGTIRRYAFRHSESSYWHWLPLLLADRVNMIEGLLHDLSRGHVPNVFRELGSKAEWQHNKRGFLTKVAIGTAITAALVWYMTRKYWKKEGVVEESPEFSTNGHVTV